MFNIGKTEWSEYNTRVTWIDLRTFSVELNKWISISNNHLLYNTNGRPNSSTLDKLNIINKGSVGSTRSAIIDITCYDDNEYNYIDNNFLKFGSMVVIQYGYSPFTSAKEFNSIDEVVNYDLSNYNKESNFYRGIFVGVITNFNQNIINSQLYKINVEITHLGKELLMMESSKISTVDTFNGEVKNNTSINLFDRIEKMWDGFQWADLLPDGSTTRDSKKEDDYVTWEYAIKYIFENNANINIDDIRYKNFLNNAKYAIVKDHPELIISVDPKIIRIVGSSSPIEGINLPKGQNFLCLRILLNFDFLKSSLLSCTNFSDLFNRILYAINDSVVGFWNLAVVPDKNNNLNIVDLNMYNDNYDNIVSLDLYNINNNNIRSISVGSNIPTSEDMVIFYNSIVGSISTIINPELYASNLFGDVYDFFGPKIDYKKTLNESNEYTIEALMDYYTGVYEYQSKSLKSNKKVLDEDLVQVERYDSIVVSDSIRKNMLLALNSNNDLSTGKNVWCNRLIPFEISMTMDGNTDVSWGDKFSINDLLPYRYRSASKKIFFFVTHVEHSIDRSDWVTAVTAVMKLDAEGITSTKMKTSPPNISLRDIKERSMAKTIIKLNYKGGKKLEESGKLTSSSDAFGLLSNKIKSSKSIKFVHGMQSMIVDPYIISSAQQARKFNNNIRDHWGIDVGSISHNFRELYAPCNCQLLKKGTIPGVGGYFILFCNMGSDYMLMRCLHSFTLHNVDTIYSKGEYIGSYEIHPIHNTHNYSLHLHFEPYIFTGPYDPSCINNLNKNLSSLCTNDEVVVDSLSYNENINISKEYKMITANIITKIIFNNPLVLK